jgi:hypothetical protein
MSEPANHKPQIVIEPQVQSHTPAPQPSRRETFMVRFIDRMQHLQPLKKAADIAAIRPLGYVVRRLGFRPDVINRVRLMAAEDSAQYITEKMMPCAVFDDRYSVFDLAIRQMPKQGLVVEFGVFNGRSINYIAKRIGARQISGFDSFEGLAEDWEGTGASKGHFGRGGVMPKVVNNVTLVKGWFDKTLPGYLEKNPGPVAFAHLDADTYESTKFVLDQLAPRFEVGTVLQFDEYLGYPGWRLGEFKALAELCAERGIKYKYLGVGWLSAAVQITAIR